MDGQTGWFQYIPENIRSRGYKKLLLQFQFFDRTTKIIVVMQRSKTRTYPVVPGYVVEVPKMTCVFIFKLLRVIDDFHIGPFSRFYLSFFENEIMLNLFKSDLYSIICSWLLIWESFIDQEAIFNSGLKTQKFDKVNVSLCHFNLFTNKPLSLSVCRKTFLKTQWAKEKLLIMSNFSFAHSVF